MDFESIRRQVNSDLAEKVSQGRVSTWIALAYLDMLIERGCDVGGAIGDYLLGRR